MKLRNIFATATLCASILAGAQTAPQTFAVNGEAKLTVYPTPTPNGTVLMMCPGGGYSHLATKHEGHNMAPWMNDMGITYAVLEYRMPQNPLDTLPILDSHAALRILADNATAWGANPDRIGIMGASAGGHLASYTANTDSLVKFQALLYPVISMTPGITHPGTRKNLIGADADAATEAKYNSANRVHPGSPKAFIVLSADDKAVIPANTMSYAQALIDAKVPVEMHMYPTGGHGWGYRDTFTYHQNWKDALAAWLEKL